MGEIRKAQMEEWKGFLTEEQQQKLKEMRQQGRDGAKKAE
jgi:hypothetical protein